MDSVRITYNFLRKLGIEMHWFSPPKSHLAHLQKILFYNKIDLVLDVGANIGQYAQSLRDIGYKGKIVSFEALSSAHAQLAAAKKKDPLWIVAPRTAVGNQIGEIKINISENSESSSILPMLQTHIASAPNSVYIDVESAEINTLNRLAPKYMTADTKYVYLKIDVQGYERHVLEGASEILPRIGGMQIELSLLPLYEGQSLFREMIDLIDSLGFNIHALLPVFADSESGRLLQVDGIFIRK